ncbi:hypothetical protein E3N88_33218 [Mikania micrantha]|uniref:Uncharacterized protein n=1 Tax=Mikania micrantha TaxID=192012 RepID=A0A5N6MDB3_9ASTR|nr:hypothetical protein E3N88_33218 [Mikania micrantha]
MDNGESTYQQEQGYFKESDKGKQHALYDEDDKIEKYIGVLDVEGDGPMLGDIDTIDLDLHLKEICHYQIYATFNVAELSPFVPEEDDLFDSRTSHFEDGENDVVPTYAGQDPDPSAP